MRKVESVLPKAAEEKSWFFALKKFLCELKQYFPAFNAVGLKQFARSYLGELRQKWVIEFNRPPKEECWRNNRHGCRKAGAACY